MSVTVLYFASLRDAAGIATEQVPLPHSLHDLYEQLRARHTLPLAPERLRVAVDGEQRIEALREPFAAIVGFDQFVALDHRPHRAVEHDDPTIEGFAQGIDGGDGHRRRRYHVCRAGPIVDSIRFVYRRARARSDQGARPAPTRIGASS